MSNKGLKLIQPISKRDQVVSTLREAIVSGAIEPGDQIVESRIAQQLGTGIPLVREALIELEHLGYVQKTPYKGTSVTKLGPKDLERIFRLRVELEALAIEWSKENVTPADIKEMEGMIRGMKQGASRLDLSQFYENDLSIHRKIWALSDNPYLVDALERVVVPLFAFFLMKTTRERQSYVESAEMHWEIVEALATTSASGLRELMKQSLAGWKDDMLKLLFEKR
ncbi:MAG TPA: GntR family transcriptional regulator [Blastocatellia bacterium]|nr:GntR family transcriptional regulator [Blastocatellia bacterium]